MLEKGLIFTYVMTAAGAVGGLFNPFLGLLAYVCFAIVRPDYLWSWSVEHGHYSRILALAMLVGWAARGFGGMDNNCVAIAMVTGVGLAFFLGLGAKEWWKKGVALFAAALMGHTILLTFSRGGMLALALTGLMTFFLIPKSPRHYLVFALAVVVGISLAGKEARERFFSAFHQSNSGKREASAQSRLDLWADTFDATLKRPLLGAGP